MRVYLGGNIHTSWRRQVVDACPSIEFLQPYKDDQARFVRTEEGVSLLPLSHFVLRDLLFIRSCDVILGYITNYAEHSRHHGLMIELGYAKALRKSIVLVAEMPEFDFAIEMADIVFATLAQGAEYLNFLTLRNPI